MEAQSLPNTDSPVICVLSGGLDSTTLLYYLKSVYKDKVYALTFNYNQRHNIEIEKAKLSCQITKTPHKIIDIDFFGHLVSPVTALTSESDIQIPKIKDVLGDPQPVSYVPYRNMLFLTLGLSYAETVKANYIFIAVQSTDLYGYWDTTPEFMDAMNKVSSLNRKHQIQLNAPFNYLLKSDEIKLGIDLGVDFSNTWSCYNGPDDKGRACGCCPTCAERIKAFMDIGKQDTIQYAIDINW